MVPWVRALPFPPWTIVLSHRGSPLPRLAPGAWGTKYTGPQMASTACLCGGGRGWMLPRGCSWLG
eukprot:525941-Alexandrium_andersonii.AAC.1